MPLRKLPNREREFRAPGVLQQQSLRDIAGVCTAVRYVDRDVLIRLAAVGAERRRSQC